ncbi:MAG: hypothetical protein Tsb009_06930 [Planctomycetaceae bacterium]
MTKTNHRTMKLMKMVHKFSLSFAIVVCLVVIGCGESNEVDQSRPDDNQADSTETLPVPKVVWLTSYSEAMALAKKSGKLVLADFTGKDWCPPCKALKQRVFESDEFKRWADKNLVLVELDFPRQGRSTEENDRLAYKHQIQGFPTVLFFSPDGGVIGRMHYSGENGKQWVAKAKKLLNVSGGSSSNGSSGLSGSESR